MNRFIRVITIIFIIVVSFVLPSLGQETIETNKVLSALRGKWEWFNYWDVQTLNFQSDSTVIYNHKPATYTLKESTLNIQTSKKNVLLRFAIHGNRLDITSEEENMQTFKRKTNGEAEQYLVNTFFSGDDVNAEFIFQENGTFLYYPPISSTETSTSQTLPSVTDQIKNGVYRVEQNIIYLTYDDGTLDAALISNRNDDNMIDQIIYNSQNYYRPLPQDKTDTIIVVETFPPIPRPCYTCPHPPRFPQSPPPPPIQPVNTPAPPKREEEKRRDFGTQRGNTEPHDQKQEATGSRTGSRGGRP